VYSSSFCTVDLKGGKSSSGIGGKVLISGGQSKSGMSGGVQLDTPAVIDEESSGTIDISTGKYIGCKNTLQCPESDRQSYSRKL
jgi:hypothetical protein